MKLFKRKRDYGDKKVNVVFMRDRNCCKCHYDKSSQNSPPTECFCKCPVKLCGCCDLPCPDNNSESSLAILKEIEKLIKKLKKALKSNNNVCCIPMDNPSNSHSSSGASEGYDSLKSSSCNPCCPNCTKRQQKNRNSAREYKIKKATMVNTGAGSSLCLTLKTKKGGKSSNKGRTGDNDFLCCPSSNNQNNKSDNQRKKLLRKSEKERKNFVKAYEKYQKACNAAKTHHEKYCKIKSKISSMGDSSQFYNSQSHCFFFSSAPSPITHASVSSLETLENMDVQMKSSSQSYIAAEDSCRTELMRNMFGDDCSSTCFNPFSTNLDCTSFAPSTEESLSESVITHKKCDDDKKVALGKVVKEKSKRKTKNKFWNWFKTSKHDARNANRQKHLEKIFIEEGWLPDMQVVKNSNLPPHVWKKAFEIVKNQYK